MSPGHVTLGRNDHFSRLPVEVLNLIISDFLEQRKYMPPYLWNRRGMKTYKPLLALSLTSRFFNAVTAPFIYATLYFDRRLKDQLSFRRILKSPHLASYVRKVVFTEPKDKFPGDGNLRRGGRWRRLNRNRRHDGPDWTIPEDMLLLWNAVQKNRNTYTHRTIHGNPKTRDLLLDFFLTLVRCKGIRTVRYTCSFPSIECHHTLAALTLSLSDLSVASLVAKMLRSVQDIEVTGPSSQAWATLLFTLLQTPTLKRLTLDDPSTALVFPPVTSHLTEALSGIRDLRIQSRPLDYQTALAILNAPQKLEALDYPITFTNAPDWKQTISELMATLAKNKETLGYLRLRANWDDAHLALLDLRSWLDHSFNSYGVLAKLDLPCNCYHRDFYSHRHSLSSFLPPSIEECRINGFEVNVENL